MICIHNSYCSERAPLREPTHPLTHFLHETHPLVLITSLHSVSNPPSLTLLRAHYNYILWTTRQDVFTNRRELSTYVDVACVHMQHPHVCMILNKTGLIHPFGNIMGTVSFCVSGHFPHLLYTPNIPLDSTTTNRMIMIMRVIPPMNKKGSLKPPT